MLSLLLTAALAAQAGSGFGWEAPIWQREFSSVLHKGTASGLDYTGDGVGEIIVFSSPEHQSLQVLDGASGNTWFELAPPRGDVHSYRWYGEDLDGDGLPEFILSNPISNAGGSQIVVVHGGDGRILWEAYGRKNNDQLGEPILLVDLDGDGLLDVFAGSISSGRAAAIKGSTGAVLWRRSGLSRRFSAVTPDLNGDGTADIFVGAANRYSVLSGATGQRVWDTSTNLLSNPRQWRLLYADVNLDGTPDVWVVDSNSNQPTGFYVGAVEVVDGASGHILWSAVGGGTGENLGKGALLQDMNGDGVDDLLTRSPVAPSLLDGRTGVLLWKRSFAPGLGLNETLQARDFNGDGLLDLLAMDRNNGSKVTDHLEAIQGANGSTLWSIDSQWPSEDFNRLTLADFDLDGVDDVLAGSPAATTPYSYGGLLRLISGASGTELWQHSGAAIGSELGSDLFLEEIDAIAGPDVIAFDLSNGADRGRFALRGSSGADIWRMQDDPQDQQLIDTLSVDLNGDGLLDVLERQSTGGSTDFTRFRAFESQTGDSLWTLDLESSPWIAKVLLVQSDLDGDGIRELVFQVDRSGSDYALHTYSGAGGGWISGLELNQTEISQSTGGAIDLNIHFPPDQAGWAYQLLLSETGNQTTNLNGLDVPLSRGYWLTSTYVGQYPNGMFFNPIGTLDDAGRARITFDVLPNQIAPAFIGTTMYLAVISAVPGGPWSFSSGSAAVQILP
jgi:VCBS repeat protein